jgi:glyoxylate reductase
MLHMNIGYPMSAPVVFCTRRIPDAGLHILREHTELRLFPHDRQISHNELVDAVSAADGLLCLLSDPVDAAVIDAAPSLRVISTYAVGYNNIDVARACARGIVVTNTPDVLTDATADIAFGLMIDCARRMTESDRWMRENTFEGWAPLLFLGQDLAGATLGVVGAGRIGQALAARAAGAFGMHILYHNRTRDEEFEQRLGARHVQLEELLREADFVSLHVPLTDATHHLIGAGELALMKPTAVLVNTSRGPVIDEDALIEALRQHRIFAAGLDVYEREPHLSDELRSLPNAVLLPHIGSASISTRDRMAVMAAQQCVDVLQGRRPAHPVG